MKMFNNRGSQEKPFKYSTWIKTAGLNKSSCVDGITQCVVGDLKVRMDIEVSGLIFQ